MTVKCRPRLACAVADANQGKPLNALIGFLLRYLLQTKNIIKEESVVPDKPVLTAWANLGRHITHLH